MSRPCPAAPSAWVARFAGRVRPGGAVLDLACGGGRHSRLFLECGHPTVAIDIDLAGVADLVGEPGFEAIQADLEDGIIGDSIPFFKLAAADRPADGRKNGILSPINRHFAGIVVAKYLYRPLFPALIEALEPGGVLIYETFAKGNERFGRPRNPDHLLDPGELLEAVRGQLRVLAYEDLTVDEPRPAAIQRICAVKPARIVD